MVTLQIASVKYGDKDFFVTDVFQDSLTINANMVSQLGQEWVTRITVLLSMTEDCVKQLSILAADLARASGDSDSSHHKAGEGAGSAAKSEAYFRLDMPFRKWLANIDPAQTDIEAAEQYWKNIVKQIILQLGEEMTHQAGEKAIIGRWVEGRNNSKPRLYTAPSAFIRFRSKILRTIEKGGL